MTLLDAKQSNPREGGPSFSLKHRLLRLVWGVVWGLLGRLSPVPFYGWRRLLLRFFGASISPSARVYPSATIWYPPNLSLGDESGSTSQASFSSPKSRTYSRTLPLPAD